MREDNLSGSGGCHFQPLMQETGRAKHSGCCFIVSVLASRAELGSSSNAQRLASRPSRVEHQQLSCLPASGDCAAAADDERWCSCQNRAAAAARKDTVAMTTTWRWQQRGTGSPINKRALGQSGTKRPLGTRALLDASSQLYAWKSCCCYTT